MFFNNLVGRCRSSYARFCFWNQGVGARRVAFLLFIRYTPSPVAWYNINLKGTYNFELSDNLPNIEDMMRSIDGYLPA